MKKKPQSGLMLLLMMFPQIVETIYSPALPDIANAFNVDVEAASQTLSIYFIAFAFGVVFWGRMCDLLGRRRSMLYGLFTYGVGTLIAIFANHFESLLLARAIAAFGAAVGSIVTQTILRDSFDGPELSKIFSLMGMGIAISPVLGLWLGGFIAHYTGYQGIFISLLALATLLTLLSLVNLVETKPAELAKAPLLPLAKRMAQDETLWRNAGLVALFNLMLFSYYSLAPFLFTSLGMSSKEFGYSGIILALGALIGSRLNRILIARGLQASTLIQFACFLSLLGAFGVYLLQSSLAFLLPMCLIVIAFGIAIPNILSQALVEYKSMVGSAGALFGLIYYLLLGLSLAAVGLVQNLGVTLLFASMLSILLSLLNSRISQTNCAV